MSESGDYDPGPWTSVAHDFTDARKSYDVHVGRSYDDAKSKKVSKTARIEKHIKTKSSAPVVIVADVTGSMGEWPAVIFSKLPYLDVEGKEYLGKDMEISFAAVGDVFSDDYPLQVRPFSSGLDLKDRLAELIIEGNGGGQERESYDMAALYYARNCDMPNAVRPILIFIGDEGIYDFVAADHAKNLCEATVEKLSIAQLFDELKQKFAVYLVRKPYSASSDSSGMSPTDKRIQGQWEELLGADHVCMLPEAQRVVDVIFGIFAKETGKVDYFKDEITGRQTADQVKTVMKSLNSLHKISGPKSLKKLGVSVTRRNDDDDDGKSLPKSKRLI
jgi:hypothetical protein